MNFQSSSSAGEGGELKKEIFLSQKRIEELASLLQAYQRDTLAFQERVGEKFLNLNQLLGTSREDFLAIKDVLQKLADWSAQTFQNQAQQLTEGLQKQWGGVKSFVFSTLGRWKAEQPSPSSHSWEPTVLRPQLNVQFPQVPVLPQLPSVFMGEDPRTSQNSVGRGSGVSHVSPPLTTSQPTVFMSGVGEDPRTSQNPVIISGMGEGPRTSQFPVSQSFSAGPPQNNPRTSEGGWTYTSSQGVPGVVLHEPLLLNNVQLLKTSNSDLRQYPTSNPLGGGSIFITDPALGEPKMLHLLNKHNRPNTGGQLQLLVTIGYRGHLCKRPRVFSGVPLSPWAQGGCQFSGRHF